MKNAADRLPLTLVAAALAIASGTAAAQQANEIVVEAPRFGATAERGPEGGPIELATVTHRVSYKDIDIGTSAGAKVLEQRINDAAKAACQAIDKLDPFRVPATDDPPCEKAAVKKAMAKARVAIAAAEKAHK
jgi:UrcA family protein